MNLVIGIILFLMGVYLFVQELAMETFIFTKSMATAYLTIGIAITLLSFFYKRS